MSIGAEQDITVLLSSIRNGDERARDELVTRIYRELRGIASRQMQRERAGHTLTPTALVHEAFIRLAGADVLQNAPNQAYLFAAAARSMRQILAEHGRKRRIRPSTDLSNCAHSVEFEGRLVDVVDLSDALEELAQQHPLDSDVVTLHIFGGLTMREVADQLDIPLRTAERTWHHVKLWLSACLGKENGESRSIE
jgi:RNA polymerase sigma factor (TIGR02999 family)